MTEMFNRNRALEELLADDLMDSGLVDHNPQLIARLLIEARHHRPPEPPRATEHPQPATNTPPNAYGPAKRQSRETQEDQAR